MAELLIKAISATNPDPEKDTRGCYKQGDVVYIGENGHLWGAEEGLPKFWIIKLPLITVAEAYSLEVMLAQLGTPVPPAIDPNAPPFTPVVRRRAAFFDINLLTGGQRNTLLNTGQLTINATFANAQNFITHKAAP